MYFHIIKTRLPTRFWREKTSRLSYEIWTKHAIKLKNNDDCNAKHDILIIVYASVTALRSDYDYINIIIWILGII